MAVDHHPEWVPRSLTAAELDLDPESPEFIAACLAVINQSANSGAEATAEPPVDAPGETTSGAAGSVATDKADPVQHLEPGIAATPHALVSRLETEIGRLRVELSDAHARLSETVQPMQEHADARESLARAHHTRSGQVHKVKGLRRNSAAREGAETLQQLVSAILSDRVADNAALREARRREEGVRADLLSLETELASAASTHKDTTKALDTAIQSATTARAELETAMIAAADQESTINDLRQVIADRDKKIGDLQEQSRQAEQNRDAEVAEVVSSVQRDHESAVAHLLQVIADRDQEISDLQEHALRAEEARIADAAAILNSLDKYRV